MDSALVIIKVNQSMKFAVYNHSSTVYRVHVHWGSIDVDVVSNLTSGATDQATTHQRLRAPQALVEAFIQDNSSHSLPNHLRQSVLREYLHKAQQG